jgi:hypothetical protein
VTGLRRLGRDPTIARFSEKDAEDLFNRVRDRAWAKHCSSEDRKGTPTLLGDEIEKASPEASWCSAEIMLDEVYGEIKMLA